MRRLAAGRGAQIEHAGAGLRRQHPRDQHRGTRLGRHAPAANSSEPWTSNASSRTRASGSTGSSRDRTGSRERTSSLVLISSLTRIAASAGWLIGQQQRPRLRRPRARSTTSPPATTGTECRTAASAGAPVVELREHCRAFAGGPPQHCVDQRRSPVTDALDQLDALVDRRMVRDAAQEQQLEQSQPQRGQHRGIQVLQRARAEPARRGDPASRDAGPSRTPAPWPAPALGHPDPRPRGQSAIGIGPLLEHPAKYRKRAEPCGRDAPWSDRRRGALTGRVRAGNPRRSSGDRRAAGRRATRANRRSCRAPEAARSNRIPGSEAPGTTRASRTPSRVSSSSITKAPMCGVSARTTRSSSSAGR